MLSNEHYFRINVVDVNRTKWTKEYRVGEEIIEFKIDTGADVNCNPLSFVRKLKLNIDNKRNEFPVFDYNNNTVNIFGTVRLKCIDLKSNCGKESLFLVVDDKLEPILGLRSCIEFGLVKRIDIDKIALPDIAESFVREYNDVF